MNFTEFYKNATDQKKLSFLDAIIKNNERLQHEFLNYSLPDKSDSEVASTIEAFLTLIKETEVQYSGLLESVDLENPDWDNYNPEHSGYIEEWEQYQQASEQEFEEIFDEFKTEAIDCIIQQQIDDLTGMLLGLYEACLNAEIADEVCSFDDVNDHLTEEHKRIMLELVDKIKLSAISGNKVNAAIQLFFEYCDAEYPGNPTYSNYFEPLLLALADISDQPGKLLSLIDASKTDRKALPQLVLLLNKNAGNNTGWLQSAQQYYLTDNEVAKQLLDYYFENDKSKFTITAHELFNTDKRYWPVFLQNKVDVKTDKALYFKVFYQLTVVKKELRYYHKIRNYISPSDFNKLLSDINWSKVFVVKILEVEKRYEEIKHIVEQNPNDWGYTELITPILAVYPAFCFNNIKTKAENTLQNERGRSIYQRIVLWLQLAKAIPGYETQTRELILQLYNHKPNLPALRDEFRSGSLV